MRLLLIHSDYIEYEAKKKTKMAEECSVLTDREEEVLTVFCAVESIDEEDLEGVVLQATHEIIKTMEQVKTDKVLIYPYAHLSSDLSSPETAVTVLNALRAGLEAEGYAVKRAPFGWYKSFKLSCKGHPLSELSKTIVPGEEGTVKKEKKEVTHDWFVLTPDGKQHDYKEYPRRFSVRLPGEEGAGHRRPGRRGTGTCRADAVQRTRGLRASQRCGMPPLDAKGQADPRPACRLRAPHGARVTAARRLRPRSCTTLATGRSSNMPKSLESVRYPFQV